MSLLLLMDVFFGTEVVLNRYWLVRAVGYGIMMLVVLCVDLLVVNILFKFS